MEASCSGYPAYRDLQTLLSQRQVLHPTNRSNDLNDGSKITSWREKSISSDSHSLIDEDHENGDNVMDLVQSNYKGQLRRAAMRTKLPITWKIQKAVCQRDNAFELGNSLIASKGDFDHVYQLSNKTCEREKQEKTLKPTKPCNYHGDVNNGKLIKCNMGHTGKYDHKSKVMKNEDERSNLLCLFRKVYKLLTEEEEKEGKPLKKRIDVATYQALKQSGKLVGFARVIGPIKGVEIGDEFECRYELMIIGLHCHNIHGIDYAYGCDGEVLATSIVATEGYQDIMVKPDMLIYTGEGGTFEGKRKNAKDQVLSKGNMALKNSIKERNFIRVLRGIKARLVYAGSKGQMTKKIFVYDGLYKVIDCSKVIGPYGNSIYQFTLKRCFGQKTIDWEKYR